MVKQPRENRVPIMMSDEELKQIDDWRFTNRIATRSDAVRRLAQIALRVEQPFIRMYRQTRETYLALMSQTNATKTGPLRKKPVDFDRAFKMAMTSNSNAIRGLALVMIEVNAVAEQLHKFLHEGNFPDLHREADAIKKEAASRAKMLRMVMEAFDRGELEVGEDDE